MTAAKAGTAKRTSKPVMTTEDTAVDTDPLLDDPNLVIVSEDLRELTVAQIEEVEDLLDDTINVFFDKSYRRGKIHRALAYVVRKAENPTLTYEQSAELRLGIRLMAQVPPTRESA